VLTTGTGSLVVELYPSKVQNPGSKSSDDFCTTVDGRVHHICLINLTKICASELFLFAFLWAIVINGGLK
jgi:hypothetical protein